MQFSRNSILYLLVVLPYKLWQRVIDGCIGPNNRIVKMSLHVDERQAASAERLRARRVNSGGGEQAKIAMSRQRRGLRWRTDGRAGTSNPATERRDRLLSLKQDACITFFLFVTILISKALRMARVSEGSHGFTCHPHAYPRME